MTRRQFFENVIAGVYLAATSPKKSALEVEEKISALRRVIGEVGESEVKMSVSDVGSLFQFIQSQAVKTPSLSFLQDEFRDINLWRQQAKSKVLELLHYNPASCDPNPEVVERVDKGDYIREKVWFNTTPDIRVPAYVLIPKNFPLPAPAIVALHDHGGFYLWGKEKLVDVDEESPALRAFRSYYSEKFIAVELVKQGYVVIVIDMFYWGERRMLFDDDPVVWKQRPNTITDEEVRAFNQRASQNEQLVGRTIYSAGFTQIPYSKHDRTHKTGARFV